LSQSAGPVRWRFGIFAALALAVVALVPQFHLWAVRGRNWHGAYASVHGDELSYSAYVRALIDGWPRRNDPYAGRADQPGASLAESYYSIQFVPAYMLAWPARLFGLSAATAFIILAPLSAFASTLALFWLLTLLTKDNAASAAGALVVLCCAAPARGGKLLQLLGFKVSYSFMPFLRRYEPSVPFPFFFIFCALVWLTLTAERRRNSVLAAAGAGLTLALLIFSYFYLWTTALAWLACLVVLWLLARPADRARVLRLCAVLIVPVGVAFCFYVALLMHRMPTMEQAQALEFTHTLDLWHPVEWLGLLLVGALVYSARRGRITGRDPHVLYTAALALTPLVVFNQQLITGRSLQPIHYEWYIASYVALLATILTALLIWRGQPDAMQPRGRLLPARLLLSLAVLALGWGTLELFVAARRSISANLARDQIQFVGERLAEIARTTGECAHEPLPVVFADANYTGKLTTAAPQAVLWAPHSSFFAGLSQAEYRDRLYHHFYYSGLSVAQFNAMIADRTFVQVWTFGWGRVMPGLAQQPAPLTPAEIEAEKLGYADFVATFDRTRAADPLLTYVIVPPAAPDLTNLDRWYTRDAGERIGDLVLYRVRLRP
jgi:hypothetical protein